MDCTVVGRHWVGEQLSLRKGRGALVVPWSAGVCQRLHWAEREWLGRDRQHLGRSCWPPPEPCRELLEQMLPPSLSFGPEERARTKSVHPIQVPVLACGVWETSGGSLTSACSVSQGGRETR